MQLTLGSLSTNVFETQMATATLALKENFLAETLRQWLRAQGAYNLAE